MNDRSPYSSWLEYFDNRRARDLDAPFDETFVDRPGREAIARSVERFELGESGDGANLKRLAGEKDDPTYTRAIELFVDEEGQHASWLGVLRERFGGTKLESHWSDAAFVALRHIGGLRREICVLLTAELVALSYYRVLAEAYDDGVLRAACRRILIDERGHVTFHRETLSREFASMPAPARAAAILAWRAFIATTVKVVAWDHREVLELAGVSRAEFEREVRQRAKRMARVIRSGAVAPALAAPDAA
jgi:hypothetical protein